MIELPNPAQLGIIVTTALATALFTFLSSGLLAYWLIFKPQKRFEDDVTRKLERFRTDLNAQLQKDIELHKKRIEVIKELYLRFSHIRENIKQMHLEQIGNGDEAVEKFKKFAHFVIDANKIDTFRNYFIENSIFLPETLTDLLAKFDSAIHGTLTGPFLVAIMNSYEAGQMEMTSEQVASLGWTPEFFAEQQRDIEAARISNKKAEWQSMADSLPILSNHVEAEFRKILGS